MYKSYKDCKLVYTSIGLLSIHLTWSTFPSPIQIFTDCINFPLKCPKYYLCDYTVNTIYILVMKITV